MGSGFRCQISGACAFRVLPAGGVDEDLAEAARYRRQHESLCRFRGAREPIALTPPPASRRIDDRRTQLASALELEDPGNRHPRRGTYLREPSGRGWKIVIAEYAHAHPRETAAQIAAAVGCRSTTAATYLTEARKA
jgi:hypothetical protein